LKTPAPIARLVSGLRRLPGIGEKSAMRLAFHLLGAPEAQVRELSDKLNPMSVSYIYGAGGSNDANEELRVREELRQAESGLLAARQGVEAANRNLEDFRQGRTPGSSEER